MTITDTSVIAKSPTLSVILATLNSASNSRLQDCLGSLSSQQYPGEIELLVSDGGSVDNTLKLCAASRARVIRNPAVTELGYQGGKNRALAESKGDFVVFVDADNILMETDYLSRMVQPLVDDSTVVLSVPEPYVPPVGEWPLICRYFTLVESDYWSELSSQGAKKGTWTRFRPASAIVPNSAVIRRSSLDRIGGWDYDTEVAARLLGDRKATFAFVHGAHRFHVEMRDYSEVWRKFDRRITHQLSHSEEKPFVRDQIASARVDPVSYVRNELARPISRWVHRRDTTYLQCIPVLGIKTTLLFLRGAWRMSRVTI